MVLSAAARLGAMVFFSGSPYEMLFALSIVIGVFAVIFLAAIDLVLAKLAREESRRVEAAPVD